jgi:hypothetical protein
MTTDIQGTPPSQQRTLVTSAAIGVVAFVLSAAWLRSQSYETVDIVVAGRELAVNERLSEEDLQRRTVPVTDGSLPRTAVLWSLRRNVEGRSVRRALSTESILFWDDLVEDGNPLNLASGESALTVSIGDVRHKDDYRPGQMVTFLIMCPPAEGKSAAEPLRVGPLRIVAVPESSGPNRVTVAIPWKEKSFDPVVLDLLESLRHDREGAWITAIVLHPGEDVR